jgi:predicted component of type VI protein secretion system
MLSDYRTWLESELKLLGNASHHAYSFGQANMAKRAIERLDQEVGERLILALERDEAAEILTALEMLDEETTALPPSLGVLRERLKVAFSDVGGAARNLYHE